MKKLFLKLFKPVRYYSVTGLTCNDFVVLDSDGKRLEIIQTTEVEPGLYNIQIGAVSDLKEINGPITFNNQ